MEQKIITYDIKRNGFNNWTLWKNIEEHCEDHGSISCSPAFRGTKKECEKEKRRLESGTKESIKINKRRTSENDTRAK